MLQVSLRLHRNGCWLGPGSGAAMVIVVMAPLIVPLVRKIPVSWMTGFGFSVLVCAMWYFASFNFATNYGREASARIVQGFGTASCLSRPANLPTRVRRRTKTIKRRVLRISSGIKVEGSALRS